MSREVRIRVIEALAGAPIHRRTVRVDSKAWVMVRNADFPNAAPFVMSRKDWEGLPLE